MGLIAQRRPADERAGWGLLGGTFDPVHYAHLAIAEQTAETLGLAKVLFIPARVPPHKGGREITDAAHRVAMLQLAIADNPRFEWSPIELERDGPSYTVDTVEQLTTAAAGPRLSDPVFIMSVEALTGLPAWREPQRLLELCRLAVVPRHGFRSDLAAWAAREFPEREDRILFLDGPDLGHSASEIRRRAGARLSIRYLVPPAVEAYIEQHALYQSRRSPERVACASPRPTVASDRRRTGT